MSQNVAREKWHDDEHVRGALARTRETTTQMDTGRRPMGQLDETRERGSVATPPPGAAHGQSWLTANRLYVGVGVLAAVDLGEMFTTFGDPRLGLGLHMLLLTTFLALAALTSDARLHAFFIALTLAPLIRIVSTGMPLLAFPQADWYLLTSIPLFVTAFLIMRLIHLAPATINLRMPSLRSLPAEVAVTISGFGLGFLEWLILRPPSLVDSRSGDIVVGTALILVVCTGFLEELLFRGVIQHVAGSLFGWFPGLLFTSALFAVLHIGHRSGTDLVFVLFVGLYFGLVVRHTKSLVGVTVAHGITNIVLLIVLPLAALGRLG